MNNLFEKALMRPADFKKLSSETQWAIDKSLGILDWDGNCPHKMDGMCVECRKRWNNHFSLKKKK